MVGGGSVVSGGFVVPCWPMVGCRVTGGSVVAGHCSWNSSDLCEQKAIHLKTHFLKALASPPFFSLPLLSFPPLSFLDFPFIPLLACLLTL